jgi:hypothetical protein
MIIILFVLITISGFFEGGMDTLQFHYDSSIFLKLKNQFFWNPQISWANKYKNNDPSLGENFLGSTTFLVALTDGWHLLKLLRNISFFISLSLIGYLSDSLISCAINILVSHLLYGIGFWLAYRKILFKK